MDITIKSGSGITQAIQAAVGADEIKNKSLSVWQQVMEQVKEANNQAVQQGKSPYYTGGDDTTKLGRQHKENWKTDFKVTDGQVISLPQAVWNRIVELLTGNKPSAPAEQTAPQGDQGADVPAQGEQGADAPPKEPPATPQVTPQVDTPVPQPVVLTGKEKTQDRRVYLADNTMQKDIHVVLGKKDGVRTYNMVDHNGTAPSTVGQRLAADTRGLLHDRYYAIDESIPDGAEVDTNKEVDGGEQLTYTIKDKKGVSHRYLMVQSKDNESLYAKGDEVFYMGGNGYYSQTFLDAQAAILCDGKKLPGVEVKVKALSDGTYSLVANIDNEEYSIREARLYLKGRRDEAALGGGGGIQGKVDDTTAPQGGTPQKTSMTEEQLNEFLAQDVTYQRYNKELEDIDAKMTAIEKKYGMPRVRDSSKDKPKFATSEWDAQLNIIGKPEYSTYTDLGFNYESFTRNLPKYKKEMRTWVDGSLGKESYFERSSGSKLYQYTNLERITLADGRRAWKTDQGVFLPASDGKPGVEKIKIDEAGNVLP